MKPVKIGLIGCGNISDIYCENSKRFESIEIVACADKVRSHATAKAKEHGIPKVCTVKQLLADKSIDVVLNLTIPAAHKEISLAALKAGKHVYLEKPLGLNRDEGQAVLDIAEKKGLLVGCAPDTVLGGGIQTVRKLIDDGWIGAPVSATAFMQCPGHESWHPNPEFYYQHGGGPMFDMGPYYLTALVTLLGPVKAVSGMTRITFPERTITNETKFGQTIEVEVPTHLSGLMQFKSGAIGTIITSFDVPRSTLPPIEIHGTTASILVPDPNSFGGPVKLCRKGAEIFENIPLTHGYTENDRAVGLADMAYAIRTGRNHRASGALAFHVLDLMQSFHEAADKKRMLNLRSTCKRPDPMPMNLLEGKLDL